MNNKVTTRLLVIAVLALGMVGSATAQSNANMTDNTTVTVQIGTKTAIDISPATLDFGTINPGSSKRTALMAGGESVGTVELENIGSRNITNIWLNASTPSSNPFGTGIASNYDAGNFMQVKPGNPAEINGVTDYGNFTFVNRKEFNESNTLSYIFTNTNEPWRYGRFRAGNQEFFWAVNTTTTGACRTGSGQFRVGINAHNQTATGSNDFRDGSGEFYSYQVTDPGSAPPYLVSDVRLNGSVLTGNRNYDVVVECGADSTTWAMRTHFNVEPSSADLTATGISEYLLSAGANENNALQPGEHFSVNVSMQIPLGVAETTNGALSGVLRVFANTA